MSFRGATNMQNKGHIDKATFFYQYHLGLSDGPPFYCSLDLIHLVRGTGLLTFICLYRAFFEVYTNIPSEKRPDFREITIHYLQTKVGKI